MAKENIPSNTVNSFALLQKTAKAANDIEIRTSLNLCDIADGLVSGDEFQPFMQLFSPQGNPQIAAHYDKMLPPDAVLLSSHFASKHSPAMDTCSAPGTVTLLFQYHPNARVPGLTKSKLPHAPIEKYRAPIATLREQLCAQLHEILLCNAKMSVYPNDINESDVGFQIRMYHPENSHTTSYVAITASGSMQHILESVAQGINSGHYTPQGDRIPMQIPSNSPER